MFKKTFFSLVLMLVACQSLNSQPDPKQGYQDGPAAQVLLSL